MPLDQIDVDKDLPGPEGQDDESEMSFLDHLEELRWHLVRSVLAVIVFAIATFVAGDIVFKQIIMAPKESWFFTYQFICNLSESLCFYPPKFELIATELGEEFIIHLKVSLLLGVVVAFPYIFYEMWKFIRPGLYPEEQKAARGIVFVCSLLFLSGILFGYFVIAPFAVSFLASYNIGAVNSPTISSYVNYMTMFTLPTGLVFELPIVVFFLSKAGLISPEFMRKYRRHAIVLILILAAIITPPDFVTQFLIGVPLFILYEVSILISKRIQKKREEESR